MRKIFLLPAIFLCISLLFSCKLNTDFKTHESGLEYKFIKENPDSVKPQIDDILVLQLKYTTANDSVLFDTKEIQGSFRMKMKEPSHKGGCIEDAFGMMHVGDSAIFKIDANNFFVNTRNIDPPEFIKPGEKLTFYIKLVKIFDYKEWKAELEKAEVLSEQEEMTLLKAYLQRTSTKVEPTASGLYFVSEKEGTGPKPKKGDLITVHYTGAFIDGRPFDSSYQRGKPFEFRLGVGEVIEGWDEGIAMMKEGGKARLVIPSKLAYGKNTFNVIPPYSTLVFEIELLKVTKL